MEGMGGEMMDVVLVGMASYWTLLFSYYWCVCVTCTMTWHDMT